eukprot:1843106-Amphidinium_carterae.1
MAEVSHGEAADLLQSFVRRASCNCLAGRKHCYHFISALALKHLNNPQTVAVAQRDKHGRSI